MKEKEIMTVKQINEYLYIDEHIIYKPTHIRLIPSIKIAGQWLFKKKLIDKWIIEESLERLLQNIKSFSRKEHKNA